MLIADRRRAKVELALGMALSGTVGLFSKMSGQPSINVVFFRCLFGAFTLAACVWLRGGMGNTQRIDVKSRLMVVASGLCLVFNWLTLFQAFRLTSIGFATIVYHLQPFWIVLFGGLVLKEGLPGRKVGWITLAFFGLALAILPRLGGIQDDPDWRTGTTFALMASLLYAATTLTTRAVKGMRAEALGAVHCLIGCVILLPFLDFAALGGARLETWPWLVALGVVHTGLVYALLYSAYPRVSTATIAAAAFLNPAAALVSDLLVFNRVITLTEAGGLGLILLAGLGVNRGWPFMRMRRRGSGAASLT